ncbi:MAG: cytochrome P450 [Acidobacteriota bacterium]
MAALRARMHADPRGVFAIGKGYGVLDPQWAQRVNAENFADTTMSDRLVDLLRGRSSPRVAWKDVRTAWVPNLKKLAEPAAVEALERRLRTNLEERLHRPLDLPWAVQRIFTRALIPIVMADLSTAERQRVEADQEHKLSRLMRTRPREATRLEALSSAWIQIRCGRVARRVLGGRARGRRARRIDLADSLVDLLPTLGMDRAAFAVTSILTAIAGPPGAVATCLLLELARRPTWRRRIAEEQATLADDVYRSAAMRVAPVTHRFVKETLRCWTSPLVLTRVARKPLEIGEERLDAGDLFHLSPYLTNRHPGSWPDADVFDPDRWLPGSGRGPADAAASVPFGWAPTRCIGAGLGSIELMLLARLMTTDYALEPEALEDVEIVMASVPLPVGFRGRFVRR